MKTWLHQHRFGIAVGALILGVALFGIWVVDRNVGLRSNFRYETGLITTPNTFFWLSLPGSYSETRRGTSVQLRNSTLPFIVRPPRTVEHVTLKFDLLPQQVTAVTLSSPTANGTGRITVPLMQNIAAPGSSTPQTVSATFTVKELFSARREYQFFLSFEGGGLEVDHLTVDFQGQALTPQMIWSKIVCTHDCK